MHTAELVREGLNVATTHQAFKSYPKELLDDIRKQKYILIIDESVDMLESVEIQKSDIELATRSGIAREEASGSRCSLGSAEYDGDRFNDFFRLLRTRDVVGGVERNNESFFYWQLSPALITSFDEVYVLTYLLEGQSLYYFFKTHGIPYTKIGVSVKNGRYEFSESDIYIPSYVSSLSDKIHILDNPKLNEVGDSRTALSANWFRTHKEDRVKVKNNIYNFFRHISNSTSDDRLWSTYSEFRHELRGNGYTKSFLAFNARATNEYKNKTALAYCVNIYMNVGQKLFYIEKGIDVDEDVYALSIMVQWIWRSAIREGGDIYLYLPSKRMRDILSGWINSLAKPSPNTFTDN